jgi:hypothetical protein
MSLNPNPIRLTRRIAPAPTQEGRSAELGPVSQRFFLKGEEQEANGYENIAPDSAARTSPAPEFDSFDKVPRNRRPLFIVAGFLSLLAIGIATSKTARGLPRQLSSMRLWTQTVVTASPAAFHAPATTRPTAPEARPAAPPATAKGSVVEPVAAREEIPVISLTPVELAVPPSAKVETSAARHANQRRRSIAEPARARSAPLHGYVWSPGANALVPAATDEGEPSGASAPKPGVAPVGESGASETVPAPFEPTRAPTTSAPILE